jgi:mannose/fructose/N-acetylgalactosamine-specific phosphotransferase system component IID
MLPLGFTVLAFSLLKKGWSAVWVMLLLLAIGIVGGHLGILGTSMP